MSFITPSNISFNQTIDSSQNSYHWTTSAALVTFSSTHSSFDTRPMTHCTFIKQPRDQDGFETTLHQLCQFGKLCNIDLFTGTLPPPPSLCHISTRFCPTCQPPPGNSTSFCTQPQQLGCTMSLLPLYAYPTSDAMLQHVTGFYAMHQ